MSIERVSLQISGFWVVRGVGENLDDPLKTIYQMIAITR